MHTPPEQNNDEEVNLYTHRPTTPRFFNLIAHYIGCSCLCRVIPLLTLQHVVHTRQETMILDLLSARQTRGVVLPSARGPRGPAQVESKADRNTRVEDLASAIAWCVSFWYFSFVYCMEYN